MGAFQDVWVALNIATVAASSVAKAYPVEELLVPAMTWAKAVEKHPLIAVQGFRSGQIWATGQNFPNLVAYATRQHFEPLDGELSHWIIYIYMCDT